MPTETNFTEHPLRYMFCKILCLCFVMDTSKLQLIYAWSRQPARSKAVPLALFHVIKTRHVIAGKILFIAKLDTIW